MANVMSAKTHAASASASASHRKIFDVEYGSIARPHEGNASSARTTTEPSQGVTHVLSTFHKRHGSQGATVAVLLSIAAVVAIMHGVGGGGDGAVGGSREATRFGVSGGWFGVDSSKTTNPPILGAAQDGEINTIICDPKDLHTGRLGPALAPGAAAAASIGSLGHTPAKAINHPKKGAFKNTTFILHTDCVPEEIKAKNPGFWAHLPIERAYVVRHNYGSISFFDFADAEKNLRMKRVLGGWETGHFELRTDDVDFEYGYAIQNSAGDVLYEIGGSRAPFYGAPCYDAQMYANYWNCVMTLKGFGCGRENVFATCDMTCKRPSDLTAEEEVLGDESRWENVSAADSYILDISEANPGMSGGGFDCRGDGGSTTSATPTSTPEEADTSSPLPPPPTPKSPPATSGTIEPIGFVPTSSPGVLIVAATDARKIHLNYGTPGGKSIGSDPSTFKCKEILPDPASGASTVNESHYAFVFLRRHGHQGGAPQGDHPRRERVPAGDVGVLRARRGARDRRGPRRGLHVPLQNGSPTSGDVVRRRRLWRVRRDVGVIRGNRPSASSVNRRRDLRVHSDQ